ncbi:MAG: NGG1p interacting factor NIF3 [Candidatus Omnitrophica bacterium]|nr:NGG1p interacting factor NIF3 [Candidatus Omnitrophota bacterium]
MKIKEIYKEIVNKGIESDVRGIKEVSRILKTKKNFYSKLEKKYKDIFDLDSLNNPFADTRVLYENSEDNISSMIVGVDVEVGELVLVDRLRAKGEKIDLVVSHHPQGKAYAKFYEVMDVQADIFVQKGLSLSLSDNFLNERKFQVERKVSAANHSRTVDAARLLDINFLCMHTPCDNLAYQYLNKVLSKENPATLGDIMDILYKLPEYLDAAKKGNPPKLVIGNNKSRCSNIHLEFTGGTEGPKNIYNLLSAKGIDTIIAMHQSEEHFNQCKQANINVIFASHIASDNLGINLMLDHLEKKSKFKIHEFSGFKRFKREK